MCLILKSEGVLSPSHRFKLGQAAVQNILPDLKLCIRAREEDDVLLVRVQSKDMTGQYIPIRKITSAITEF